MEDPPCYFQIAFATCSHYSPVAGDIRDDLCDASPILQARRLKDERHWPPLALKHACPYRRHISSLPLFQVPLEERARFTTDWATI